MQRAARTKDYIRGFGFQGGGSTVVQLQRAGLRRRVQEVDQGSDQQRVVLAGFGECLAALRQLRRDRSQRRRHLRHSGAARNMSWGENDKKMIPDMAATAAEMMEAAGAKNIQPFTGRQPRPWLRDPRDGHGAHGRDRKTSVLNQFCRRTTSESVRHGRVVASCRAAARTRR